MFFSSIATLFASLSFTLTTTTNNVKSVTELDINQYFGYVDYDSNDSNSLALIHAYGSNVFSFNINADKIQYEIWYNESGSSRLFLRVEHSTGQEYTCSSYMGLSQFAIFLTTFYNQEIANEYIFTDLISFDNFTSPITSEIVNHDYDIGDIEFVFLPLGVARHLSELQSDASYQEGYNSGYETGITEGTQTGYNNGYSEGHTIGYSEGLSEGLETGHITEIWTNVLNVGVLPINILLAMLNFEVFGINIGTFVTMLLTIALILIVCRTIFNGGSGTGKE